MDFLQYVAQKLLLKTKLIITQQRKTFFLAELTKITVNLS